MKKYFMYILFVIVLIILTGSVVMVFKDLYIERTTEKQEKNMKLTNEIVNFNDILYKYMTTETLNFKQMKKEELKDDILKIHELIYNIYKNLNKSVPEKNLQKNIIESLRNLKFNDDTGFYYILSTDGIYKLFPYHSEYENKSILTRKDIDGEKTFSEIQETIDDYGQGYVSFITEDPLTRENIKNRDEKINYIKLFDPYNWIIGSGYYINDELEDYKKIMMDSLNKIFYKTETNYYICDKNNALYAVSESIFKNNEFLLKTSELNNLRKVYKKNILGNMYLYFINYNSDCNVYIVTYSRETELKNISFIYIISFIVSIMMIIILYINKRSFR